MLRSNLLKTILILTLFIILLQFFQENFKFERNAILTGEIWRIWTGSLVHTNWSHVFINLFGLWLLLLLFIDHISSKRLVFYLIILITGVGLGLFFLLPKVFWYVGLSGALYGLYFLSGFHAILDKNYPLGMMTLILTAGKVIWDVLFETIDSFSEKLIDAPIVNEAHTFGLLTAVIIVIWILIQNVAKNKTIFTQ